jgi:vanillate/3-O-methylgallate O-demethylase
MGTETKPQSLQALLDTVPNVVDYLYRNPPKTSANVFSVMMPSEVVRPEYTTWRDEQRSWRETVALHDQSYHMQSLYVRGRDALRLFERLAVNTFKTFTPGAAKQFLACSPEGYVIGDGILYYLDAQTLLLVGNPSTTDWAQFNAERGGFDVSVELDPMWVVNRARKRIAYRYQVEGPNALKLLERLNGGSLPEIKFFRSGMLSIAGCQVRAMRHSMGGVPGLELSGPWEDRDKVDGARVRLAPHRLACLLQHRDRNRVVGCPILGDLHEPRAAGVSGVAVPEQCRHAHVARRQLLLAQCRGLLRHALGHRPRSPRQARS